MAPWIRASICQGGWTPQPLPAWYRKNWRYPLQTFTLADDPDNDDLKAARAVAQALGTEHHEFMVSIDDYWRWLPDYVAHYEGLMAGGYVSYPGRSGVFIYCPNLCPNMFGLLFLERGLTSSSVVTTGYTPILWVFRTESGIIWPQVKNSGRLRNAVEKLFPYPEREKVYRRNLFDDLLRAGLSNYHLQSVDRSGGAFGFEIRPMYLEDDLSQWAMELPIDYKVL